MAAPIFSRLRLVTGDTTLDALNSTEVIVFGVGGVGSWCAEALVRSGIHRISLVDSDVICITNVNRQLQATTKNVGKSKVNELRDRLLEINPKAEINAIHSVYDESTKENFDLNQYDYVIDAIDSLTPKVDLIQTAMESSATLYSSMGAGNKIDPTRIQKSSIWKTEVCGLSRAVRKKLRRSDFKGDFEVVYSDELIPPVEHTSAKDGSHVCFCPKFVREDDTGEMHAHDWCDTKAEINGSVAHITTIFGNFLAGMVIQDVYHKVREMESQIAG